MGWFWGGSRNNQDDRDPTNSLDPVLKDFLNSQQPKPYVPTEARPTLPSSPGPGPIAQQLEPLSSRTSSLQPFAEANTTAEPSTKPTSTTTTLAPPPSLFPDGRYAHLWKTYTPPSTSSSPTSSTILPSTSTPLERLTAFRKDRRHSLHLASLENCAFEHLVQQNCFSSGDLSQRTKARLTMCREETKAFNRCYMLQGKFLQALGYMAPNRQQGRESSEEEDEIIQMHADKLYHQMMDHEAAVDAARRDGTPIPPLSSVFDTSRPAPTTDELALPEGLERKLKTPLDELPPHERELAVRAAVEEAKVREKVGTEMDRWALEMEEQRRDRRKKVAEILGEPVARFAIPDLDPSSRPRKKGEGGGGLEKRGGEVD